MIQRIGIVAPEFPPDLGGVQSYSYELCCQLAKRGYKLTIVVPISHNLDSFSSDILTPIPYLHLRRRYDIKLIQDFDVDVWHCLNASYAWMACLHPSVFVSVHGNDFLEPYIPTARLDLRDRLKLPFGSRLDYQSGIWLTKRSISKSLPHAKQIFSNSHYTKSRLLDIAPSCSGKISVPYVGVSDFYFELPVLEQAICYHAPHFITVSRLSEPRKNIHLVLEALSCLMNSYSFHYTIVGDGDLRVELEKLVADLNLSERVTFTGRVDRTTLRDKIRFSDLFILTSSSNIKNTEGFGIVYLEANACGVPVLASSLGGSAEAVEPGLSGFFIDKVDTQSIQQALSRFMHGSVLFKRSSCRAFAERYTWSNITDRIIESYKNNP